MKGPSNVLSVKNVSPGNRHCFITKKNSILIHRTNVNPCGKDFTDDNALKRHDCEKRSARDKERFTCWMCDEYCYDHCGYLYHMYKHMQG